MKYIFFFVLFVTIPSGNAGEIFFVPSETVNSWGYRIVKDHDGNPFIKRIEQMPTTQWRGPGWHPSFYLKKTCFSSNQDAVKEQKDTLDLVSEGRDRFKTYLTTFVVDSCMYSVEAGAELFYVEYQSDIVTKLRGYVLEKQDQDYNRIQNTGASEADPQAVKAQRSVKRS